MPKSKKEFRLVASARVLGNRKGEVTVYSAIYPYRYGDDDPTVTSNDFIKALDEMDVDEITVRINSPGGVVSEAVAIRTALMKHPAAKRIDIEGCCDSAATLIACLPGATVRMAKGGEYMIHRCSGAAFGNADKFLSAYNSAMQTDKDMAGIYAERTGKTEEECLALMKAETWYGAEEAKEAGFVDEIITGPDEEEIELAACALDAEEMELMRACYEHAPDHPVREARAQNNSTVSNGSSAVAADSPTENIGANLVCDAEAGDQEGTENMRRAARGACGEKNEGVNHMELKDATAEQLRQENPTLAQTIAQQAVTAERERTQRIDRLTPKGAKFAEMAKKAKADGTSAEDFFTQVIEAQEKEEKDYLEARNKETAPANNVGGGDCKDLGDPEETAKKAAKEIADMAKDVSFDATAMM